VTEAAVERPNLRGWLVWGAGAAFFAYAFVHRISPSVMYDRLMAEFAATGAVLGNLSACYFYAYGLMQLPVGLLLDRFGPRLLLTLSALVAAGGCLAFGWAESLEAAYAGRLLIGLGSAASFIGALTLAAQGLPAHRYAMVAGLTQAIAMFGGVAAQAPLAAVVAAIGWRETTFGFAGLGLAMALLIWLGAGGPQSPPPRAASGAARGAATVLRNPQTWLACLYCSLMSAPAIAFAVLWGVPWLEQAHGLPRTEAAFGASMALLGWACCAPPLGWLSERIRGRRPIMLAAPAAAFALWSALLLWREPPFAGLCALIFAVGATHGSMALSFVVAREANPPHAAGFALAVTNMSSILLIALFQPLVGWLLDLQWQGAEAAGARMFSPEAYVRAFLIFPASGLVTFLGMLALRETHPARRG
jgi:MFS family permease